MTKDELVSTLVEYASKAFRVDTSAMGADTVIAEELGISSMKQIAMTSLIENNFDVVIPAREFGKYATIGDLADKILEEMEG